MPCIQHVHSRISARPCDSVPVRPNQRRDRACPRSPEASAASSASTPATPGTRPRSYGSHRRDRFDSRLAPARSGTRIRRSIDPDRKAQRWDHRQHGGSLWSGTKETGAKRRLVRRAIFPKLAPGLSVYAQAFVVRHAVLHDQRFHALWMRQCHPKTDRHAVVLHVKGITREP